MVKLSKNKVIKAIENSGGILSTIAKRCDVSRKGLYDYLQKFPELNSHIQSEKEILIDLAENKCFQLVQDGNEGMIKYVLSRLGKVRGYTERTEIFHEGSMKNTVTFDDFQKAYNEKKGTNN